MRLFLLVALFAMLIPGCATTKVPEARPVHGVAINTLQGSVNLSLETASGSSGGRGYLIFRQPDTFRLTILSPFGQALFELYVNAGNVTCLIPAKKQAWQGNMADLPENLGARVWPLLQWVVEPPHPAGAALERIFSRPDGSSERVRYDMAGFVLSKENSLGDVVSFGDYHVVDGVAVPWRIELKTATMDRLRLLFDEPEVNSKLDEELLAPQLEGMEILPLSQFHGL